MINQKKVKRSSLLFLFIVFNIILGVLIKNILKIDSLIYSSLSEKLTTQQLEFFFKAQDKWVFFSYLVVAIFLLIKIATITSVFFIGCFFYSKEKIEFKSIWLIVIKAEFIFLLIPIIKVIWFHFFQTNYTLEDIQYFYPLSALNITGYKGLEPWLIYPFQTLNLFELAYIIYLSYQIGNLTKTNADNGLKIVCYSYLPALLLWVTVVMFFTLNYS